MTIEEKNKRRTKMSDDIVSIRKFKAEDIPDKVRWINDENNNQFLHYDLPLKEENTTKWFENNKNRTDRYDAVIEYNGKPVGIIGLLTIGNGEAEYYVTLGEGSLKGKGIAGKATKLLLEYAFKELKLDYVYLYTETENHPAQRLFEKMGFEKSGIAEKSAVNRGKLVDRYFYKICLKEYFCNE